MRISLNWLKKYVDIKIPNEELIRLIGSRLVEVEGVIDETHKYDDIYVVKVEKTEKIPDTHLTLCQINNGDEKLIQVVCGAPNVREGMLAVWIKPGAIVPASVHEDAPFVIGERRMLGKYDSCGMLAGADELDFDDKHEKIAEINPEIAKAGDRLVDIFDLDDLILEIENKSLTHRPDCFGIIGFAREVSGILGQRFDEPDFLNSETVFPQGFLAQTKTELYHPNSNIEIKIKDADICRRYTCASVKVNDDTSKQKYLNEMQILLAKSGMYSNLKIVDVTNYLMLLTGQPLHAFDYDKFISVGKTDTPNIIVRTAKVGEKLTLLDDREIECTNNDILVTSNDVPVALAGAMGGKSTAIDENTKNILLEAASFSLYNLRKTQMNHGVFSEAITRFTKGVPTSGTFNVLAEAIKEMNGRPIDFKDNFPGGYSNVVVKITADEINKLLGTEYSKALIVQTLENVGFYIKDQDEYLEIISPNWRTDIRIKEDIVEEVGRLLGYDNIVPTLPLHGTAVENSMFKLKSNIRERMYCFGANEILTYSFVSETLLKKVGQNPKNSYKIINSISPDLQYIRQSIIPSLLEKTFVNEKLPVNKFAIYEMNKVYQRGFGLDDDGVPLEKMKMGFIVAERKGTGTAYYKAKKYINELFKKIGISVEYLPLKEKNADTVPFENRRSAEIRLKSDPSVLLGVVGEFKKSVKHNFKLSDFLAGFEIDMDLILKYQKNKTTVNCRKIKDDRDLTITTRESYADTLKKLEEKYPEAEISPISIYQADGQETKNMTFNLRFY